MEKHTESRSPPIIHLSSISSKYSKHSDDIIPSSFSRIFGKEFEGYLYIGDRYSVDAMIAHQIPPDLIINITPKDGVTHVPVPDGYIDLDTKDIFIDDDIFLPNGEPTTFNDISSKCRDKLELNIRLVPSKEWFEERLLIAQEKVKTLDQTKLHLRIPIMDNYHSIVGFLPGCISLMTYFLKNKKRVLVHCIAGMSRSVTCVAGFLALTTDLDVNDGYERVKQCRKKTNPCLNLMFELFALEKNITGKDSIQKLLGVYDTKEKDEPLRRSNFKPDNDVLDEETLIIICPFYRHPFPSDERCDQCGEYMLDTEPHAMTRSLTDQDVEFMSTLRRSEPISLIQSSYYEEDDTLPISTILERTESMRYPF